MIEIVVVAEIEVVVEMIQINLSLQSRWIKLPLKN